MNVFVEWTFAEVLISVILSVETIQFIRPYKPNRAVVNDNGKVYCVILPCLDVKGEARRLLIVERRNSAWQTTNKMTRISGCCIKQKQVSLLASFD